MSKGIIPRWMPRAEEIFGWTAQNQSEESYVKHYNLTNSQHPTGKRMKKLPKNGCKGPVGSINGLKVTAMRRSGEEFSR